MSDSIVANGGLLSLPNLIENEGEVYVSTYMYFKSDHHYVEKNNIINYSLLLQNKG